jgi:hypothetical protein
MIAWIIVTTIPEEMIVTEEILQEEAKERKKKEKKRKKRRRQEQKRKEMNAEIRRGTACDEAMAIADRQAMEYEFYYGWTGQRSSSGLSDIAGL